MVRLCLRLEKIIRALLIVALMLILSTGVHAQEEVERPATNLELLRRLAFNIAAKSAGHDGLTAGYSEASLAVYPAERAWYIESALADGLKSVGFKFPGSVETPVSFQFGIIDARIEYGNAAKEGLFGSKLADRTVRLELETKISVGKDSNAVVFVQALRDSVMDRIEVAAIPRVENKLIPITQGVLPQEGFFANLAEPLIVVGSIAIAVLLLFNVRS